MSLFVEIWAFWKKVLCFRTSEKLSFELSRYFPSPSKLGKKFAKEIILFLWRNKIWENIFNFAYPSVYKLLELTQFGKYMEVSSHTHTAIWLQFKKNPIQNYFQHWCQLDFAQIITKQLIDKKIWNIRYLLPSWWGYLPSNLRTTSLVRFWYSSSMFLIHSLTYFCSKKKAECTTDWINGKCWIGFGHFSLKFTKNLSYSFIFSFIA